MNTDLALFQLVFMSNKCLDRGRQNKKSFRMTETSFVDFIKYANSNKIWILTLLKEQTLEMFLEILPFYATVEASQWLMEIPLVSFEP